ncbi:GLE1-domain-containing protein [Aspergillus costaricaensis CBS 115574]|uniref:GLE1-domain-containing protein n=1 Tax=Aspergillus costaricaensis CBS 115574 TaxID=1448317 RepID=A0ACD1IU34_9EURO|nr:GLE1-domain-containing protein [Aspergillus costaricaensis CBS 115574]RAK93585.1 GLE1-domain-containing protein [Aspergillus costaricaensis CBS 115574]
MGHMSYPSQMDSPSRQLVLDLARDLEQLRMHNTELKKVKAYERRSFYENLDRIDSELEAQHNAALDKAAALHDRVLVEAEETLRAHQRAVEEELRRREEEARKEAERIEREKAEKLRREQEETARQNRKRQEETRKAEQEASQRQAEAAQKAQAERQRQVGGARLTDEEIKIQARYVELHQHLKKFRQYLKNEAKTNAIVKQNMGDMRRTIKKCVGQLREGKGANKTQLQEIRTTLEKAASIAEPSVDVRQFIAFPPENIANSDDNKVPALLIYALNIFSKCMISSLITEASINLGHAEPVGIVAAQIFSADAFIYKGCHMVDILLAKYRVVCPALWGFHGSEKTEGGRRALGWWREGPDGPYISEQAHADRMTALGAGYAALTLRNFGKTARKNPFPNTMFWYTMHKILNIPPAEIQDTHVTLLSAMLKSSAERIVGFFGHIGLALMRKAIVELPDSLPRQSMSVNQLKLLKDLYKREKNILL